MVRFCLLWIQSIALIVLPRIKRAITQLTWWVAVSGVGEVLEGLKTHIDATGETLTCGCGVGVVDGEAIASVTR